MEGRVFVFEALIGGNREKGKGEESGLKSEIEVLKEKKKEIDCGIMKMGNGASGDEECVESF